MKKKKPMKEIFLKNIILSVKEGFVYRNFANRARSRPARQ
jgi:hypothetical protein